MKKAEMKVYKQALLSLRARLRGDVTAMADLALNKSRSEAGGSPSSMPIHMADIGSDNYEQEFTLTLMQTEEMTLGVDRSGFGKGRRRLVRRVRRVLRLDQQSPAAGDSLHAAMDQVCPKIDQR